MIKYFLLIFSIIISSSCHKKIEVLNNFGELKLGMTVQELERNVNQKIILKTSLRNRNVLASTLINIKISNNIVLGTLRIEVYKNKIMLMQTINDSLYKYLAKEHKVTWKLDGVDSRVETIETNGKNIVCEFIYNKSTEPQNVLITIFYGDKFNIGSS